MSGYGRSPPPNSRRKTGQATADVEAVQFRHQRLPCPPAPLARLLVAILLRGLACLANYVDDGGKQLWQFWAFCVVLE